MKPPAFCEWMFRQLGASRGDRLDDLFPGSGAVSEAWRRFTDPEAPAMRDVSFDVAADASPAAGIDASRPLVDGRRVA